MQNLYSDKIFKTSILIAVLLISFSVAYYYLIFLPDIEKKKIEIQKQEQTEKELRQQADQEYQKDQQEREKEYQNAQKEQDQEHQREQEKKEYIAKRKKDCYDLYLQEKKQWNNVEDVDYSEVRDVCLVIYKSNESSRSREECDKILENISKTTDALIRDMVTRSYTNCLNNTFSKEF